MRILISLSMLVLLAACTKLETSNDQNKSASNGGSQVFENPNIGGRNGIPQAQKDQLSMPGVTKFGIYNVRRTSGNVNEHGQHMPPYSEVEIYNIYWNLEPNPGEKVTVIPLNFQYPPFDVSVLGVKKTNEYSETCGSEQTFWQIQLEKLTDRRFFDMKSIDSNNAEAYPFDVFLVYPATKFARQISRNEIKKEMLPRGFNINEIEAAIDLTNDGEPDLLQLGYCCERGKSQSDPACDYSDCGNLQEKVGSKWKQIRNWGPC